MQALAASGSARPAAADRPAAAAASGLHDATIRYRLRALERDRYDEGAHLGLVSALLAAARHGEARRAYHDYVARMEEIGVEPAPLATAEPRRAPGGGLRSTSRVYPPTSLGRAVSLPLLVGPQHDLDVIGQGRLKLAEAAACLARLHLRVVSQRAGEDDE
jgi:Bacterial transcriptional activator domain